MHLRDYSVTWCIQRSPWWGTQSVFERIESADAAVRPVVGKSNTVLGTMVESEPHLLYSIQGIPIHNHASRPAIAIVQAWRKRHEPFRVCCIACRVRGNVQSTQDIACQNVLPKADGMDMVIWQPVHHQSLQGCPIEDVTGSTSIEDLRHVTSRGVPATQVEDCHSPQQQ